MINTTSGSRILKTPVYLATFIVLTTSGQNLFATNATDVKNLSAKTVQVGIAAQDSHEAWVEEKHRLLEEVDDLEHRLEHIQWQRQKLMIYGQGLEEKIVDLRKKAATMEAVNLQLLPILEDTLARLKTSLNEDIPSNMSERNKSVLHAQTLLNDYDMGLLDKTRAVLDAVAREVDLGHRVDVRVDEIEVHETGRRVKTLQVGRIGLYAITLDGKKGFRWDKNVSQWIALENDISPINEAIEMAEGIRLVGLNSLPVDPPAALK